MIARTWSGRVPVEFADGFHRHLLETGVQDYRRQRDCREVLLLRLDDSGWARFVLISIWESMAAIRAFAGDDPNTAVLYPGDDAFQLIPDALALHYSVLSLECGETP